MDVQRDELEEIFIKANKQFLRNNSMLFKMEVSERTLCGALMLELYEIIKTDKTYSEYFVDVEYNRNAGSKLKPYRKAIKIKSEEIVTINCDLIVHSRAQKKKDNLIAIEMKKSTARKKYKESDIIRLECLTQKNVINSDGEKLTEHVCGYELGIYYEINFSKQKIEIRYYKNGHNYEVFEMDFNGKKIQGDKTCSPDTSHKVEIT